jgi:lactoylglutathione lyase
MNDLNRSLNVKQAVPFFMVVDMEKSLLYYLHDLGFELKIKWEPAGKIEWCWLQIGEAAIMLQEYRSGIPAETRGRGVSVCFMCDNALLIYKRLVSRGMPVPEPFVGNNLWVVQSKDPDGYDLFFESPTEVPEGTTYSQWTESKPVNPDE